MRAIDVDAAIVQVERCEKIMTGDKTVGVEHVKTFLMNRPTLPVIPAQVGRWTDGNEWCPVCGKSKYEGLDADVFADWQPPHCPNCGAKMMEGEFLTNAKNGSLDQRE